MTPSLRIATLRWSASASTSAPSLPTRPSPSLICARSTPEGLGTVLHTQWDSAYVLSDTRPALVPRTRSRCTTCVWPSRRASALACSVQTALVRCLASALACISIALTHRRRLRLRSRHRKDDHYLDPHWSLPAHCWHRYHLWL